MDYEHIIKFSGGNDSIALAQFCVEKGLKNIAAVYNDTGWASPEWPGRMDKLREWLKDRGIDLFELKSIGMFELAKKKKSWPSTMAQFCTTQLKIEPYQQWVEEIDPEKEATVLCGIRRAESQRRSTWPEWVEESELDGGRSLWSPLVNHSNEERDELVYRAGWTPLPHRSQECHPCIYGTREDIKLLSAERVSEIEAMEKALGFTSKGKPRTFFRPAKKAGAVGIREAVDWANSERGKFNRDQGLLFGCDSGFCGG